jgi:alkylation response protein AidB-like acyl-CoA dehydrogenase
MLSFSLSGEQEAIVSLARDLAQKEFKAKAFEWRLSNARPVENLKRLRDVGLLGMTIPVEYGGGGRTPLESMLVTEAISSVCPTTAAFANVYDLGPTGTISYLGSPEQKAWLLPKFARGELEPSIAVTEPEAGSSMSGLRTTGRMEGDRCIINGGKIFTSRADAADIFLVYVRFGEGSKNIGAVIVERGTPGFSIGPANHHMSGDTWAPLYFDQCSVPAGNVVPVAKGYSDLIAIYSIERTAAAAKCLGIAQCALDRAVEYAHTRRQFGQPIAQFQGLRWKFADMALRLESARLLTYRAAANAQNGRPSRKESSMAKLAASEAACFVCDEAMQVLGAMGMSVEVGMEWLYRLARGYRVAGGTSEIHRNMIADAVLDGR